jgi:signal transduction histidine kinase/DNA-binding response OmpR family regulator/ligand-binding sensor domain-containing protein
LSEIQAQSYLPVARHFSLEDGLPHRQINCILEDRQGFIWVATNGGVARFDGLRFKIFNKADNGLTNDHINWMLEDAAGNLWLISAARGFEFSTIGSIDILNPVSGQITPFDQYIQEKPPVSLENLYLFGLRQPDTSSAAHPAKPGTLIFGTRAPGGWVSWHPETGWNHLALPSQPYLALKALTPQGGVIGYIKDTPQDILVETDAQGNVLRRFQGDSDNYFSLMHGGSQNGALFIVEENKARTEHIIWSINPGEDKKRIALQLPKNHPTLEGWGLLFSLEKEGLWITELGVFNQKREVLLNLNDQFPKFNNLPLSYNYRDRNGGIWLSTGFGLEQIEIRKDHFRRFLFDENALNARGTSCRSILQQGDNLWINTEGPEPSRKGIKLKTGQVFFEEQAGSAFGLTLDGAGNLWSGQTYFRATGISLTQGDAATGKIVRDFPFKIPVPWIIFPLNDTQFWIGTETGLVFFNPLTGQSSQPDIRLFPELEKASIVHIGREDEKNQNTLWICSSTGFYKMNAEGQVLERYWSGGEGNHWLPFDNFYHFYKDQSGVFWLGTAGGGLLRWNPRAPSVDGGGEKQVFSRKNGLLNGFVYAVYEDDFEHLWLPTDYGIAQFDKKNGAVRRTWLPADGLTQYEFNRTSHHRGGDGTLYFGGMNGVTAFHPKDFYSVPERRAEGAPASAEMAYQSEDKKLILTDFKLYSATSEKLENRTAELIESDKIGLFPPIDGIITMHPSDRYFQLEFALLDYFSPEKVTYSYLIEGIDGDWNILNEPLLRLSSLPFGTHRLKIRAQSADGIWAKNELHFILKILPPFYLRWWFLLLAMGLVSGSVYYFYRFQLRRRLAEKEAHRLQELDTFKSRLFTNITHEFRTPLTVILGTTDQLKMDGEAENPDRKKTKLNLISRNGERLLRLVNQILDLAKIENNSLQFNYVQGDVLPFLRYLTESLQSMANFQEVQLSIESADPAIVMDYDPERLQQIVHNLLSNAIKFTPSGGNVTLRATLLGPMDSPFKPSAAIHIAVEDSGIGVPPEDLSLIFDRFYQVKHLDKAPINGTGIGLALTKELVHRMGGTLTVQSEPGKGATFTAIWPITNQAPLALDDLDPEKSELVPVGHSNHFQAIQTPGTLDPELPSLLIIEDNPDVVEFLSTCLQGTYQLDFAYNGKQGIEKALETVPDLIISDVMMPEKNGFEVCEYLKNDLRTSHIPILLLTAKVEVESRIVGLQSGADAYLAKPFHQHELLLTLRNLLLLRKALQARYSKLAEVLENPVFSEQLPIAPVFEMEDAFVQKLRQHIEENLTKSDLSVEELSRMMTMSYQSLHRKLSSLTNHSPVQFIRLIRLTKARTLLQNTDRTITDIAYSVGFNDAKYFSRVFTEEFGQTPSSVRVK